MTAYEADKRGLLGGAQTQVTLVSLQNETCSARTLGHLSEETSPFNQNRDRVTCSRVRDSSDTLVGMD